MKENYSLLVGTDPIETRVVLLRDGILDRYYIDRKDRESVLGNVYFARVVKVIPGLRAAFIDAGLKKSVFLPSTQVIPEELMDPGEEKGEKGEENGQGGEKPQKIKGSRRARGRRRGVSVIERSIHEGEEIMIQVIGLPGRDKGPKASTYISLAGHYIVSMPTIQGSGVSKKIAHSKERDRLRGICAEIRKELTGGFIIRSASEGADSQKILDEARWLKSRWSAGMERIKGKKPPLLMLPELSLPERILRELGRGAVREVVVDDPYTLTLLKTYAQSTGMDPVPPMRMWTEEADLFGKMGVEEKIERAFARKVPLASGGTIVIDQAEALTAIDVNTGSFTGERDHSQTVLTTNLEAVREIAYQLRLRAIGGLIILDLIDMDREEHKEAVYRELLNETRRDKAKVSVRKISDMGLIEMTRERYGPGIMDLLQERCWYCDGTGGILSRDAICARAMRGVVAALKADPSDLLVTAHQSIALRLENEYGKHLRELEQKYRVKIKFDPKVDVHIEYFRIASMGAIKEPRRN